MQLHDGLAAVMRHLVNVALRTACFYAEQGSTWLNSDPMRDEIAEHLVLQLAASSPLLPTPSQRDRTRAVNNALEIIEAGLGNGISIGDVAMQSGLGRRTLEYAFRDRLGVSPKAFINSQRLILTRRDLRALTCVFRTPSAS
jgi:transcriptional regulator GlxA family with amidase domain